MLLIAALVLPGNNRLLGMTAHANDVELKAMAMTVGDMPCDEGMPMPPPDDHHYTPCEEGCCPQSFCDFSACLATGVLPSFVQPLPALPATSMAFAWYSSEPPSLRLDTPLRPPIV